MPQLCQAFASLALCTSLFDFVSVSRARQRISNRLERDRLKSRIAVIPNVI